MIYRPEGGSSLIKDFIGINTRTSLEVILETFDSKLASLFLLDLNQCGRTMLSLPGVTNVKAALLKLIDHVCEIQDRFVKISSSDTTSGYLFNKVVTGECVKKRIVQDSNGEQTIEIYLDYPCIAQKLPTVIEVNCCNQGFTIESSLSEICNNNLATLTAYNCSDTVVWYKNGNIIATGATYLGTAGSYYAKCGTIQSNTVVVAACSCVPNWVDKIPVEIYCGSAISLDPCKMFIKQVNQCNELTRWVEYTGSGAENSNQCPGCVQTPQPVPVPVPVPVNTPTPVPVPTNTPTPTPVPVPTNSPVPVPVPTNIPTPIPVPVDTPTPVQVPTPVNTPTPVETPVPVTPPQPIPTGQPPTPPQPVEPPVTPPQPISGCVSASFDNASGSDGNVNYTDCNGNSQSEFVANGSSATVCLQDQNSYSTTVSMNITYGGSCSSPVPVPVPIPVPVPVPLPIETPTPVVTQTFWEIQSCPTSENGMDGTVKTTDTNLSGEISGQRVTMGGQEYHYLGTSFTSGSLPSNFVAGTATIVPGQTGCSNINQ